MIVEAEDFSTNAWNYAEHGEKVERSWGAIDKELVGEEKPGKEKERVSVRERQREREAGEVSEDYTSETR